MSKLSGDSLKLALSLWGKSTKWTLSGEEYSGLRWKDDEIKKPTEQELLDVYIAGKYTYERKYPPTEKQLEMLFDELKATGTISQSGEWFKMQVDIKKDIPKGE